MEKGKIGQNQEATKAQLKYDETPPQERHWGACRGRKEKELRSRRKSRLCSSERILKFGGSAFWFICSLSCLASTALYVMEFPPGPLFVCTWTLQNKEEDFIANSVSTLVLKRLSGKTLLLNSPQALVLRHREVKLELGWKCPLCWLALNARRYKASWGE